MVSQFFQVLGKNTAASTPLGIGIALRHCRDIEHSQAFQGCLYYYAGPKWNGNVDAYTPLALTILEECPSSEHDQTSSTGYHSVGKSFTEMQEFEVGP